jgi:hypothetical protein
MGGEGGRAGGLAGRWAGDGLFNATLYAPSPVKRGGPPPLPPKKRKKRPIHRLINNEKKYLHHHKFWIMKYANRCFGKSRQRFLALHCKYFNRSLFHIIRNLLDNIVRVMLVDFDTQMTSYQTVSVLVTSLSLTSFFNITWRIYYVSQLSSQIVQKREQSRIIKYPMWFQEN